MVCRLLQCLFLLRLCQEVLLRGFRWFFFFDDLLCRKRKVNAECVSLPHEWNRQSHTAGKSGRMTVAVRQNKFHRIGNIHTSFVGTCPFHASGDVFSLFRGSFFTDFLLKFFLPNLPPLPFTSIFASFSDAASGSHFRSGRKGNSGIGRKCKVKPPVFGKNHYGICKILRMRELCIKFKK